MLLMLRSLLESRFNLKVHRETKEVPVYVISVAKGGIKLQASSCTPDDPNQAAQGAPNEANPKRCGQMRYGSNGSNRTVDAVGVKMVPWAATLSQRLGRTVVDKT